MISHGRLMIGIRILLHPMSDFGWRDFFMPFSASIPNGAMGRLPGTQRHENWRSNPSHILW